MKARVLAPIKTIRIILIICIIALVAVIAVSAYQICSAKGFIKTEATITNISTKIDYGYTNNSLVTKHKYIQCKYTADGVIYEAEFPTLFSRIRSIGNKVNVYYNPLSPAEIFDSYAMEWQCLATLFLAVFVSGLFIIIKQK